MPSRFQELIGEMLDYWLPGVERLTEHRPGWLFGMELDFYYPTLNLAVEVQGKQHYKFVPKFHSSRNDLKEQRWRDERKKLICKQRGITMIIARQKGGKFACGLEQIIREKLGIKMKRPTQDMRRRWKMHSNVMHKLSIGEERCRKEWQQSPQLLALLK